MTLQLTSPAFGNEEAIPKVFTCDGDDVSPPLEWSGVPPRTKAFALVCDDPDAPAGIWVHWVLYDLAAAATSLPQGVPKKESYEHGAHQGRNDFQKAGYGGPCPPPGTPHRYFFKLYALDAALDLKAGATKEQLEKAMKGHVLEEAQLMGTYRR